MLFTKKQKPLHSVESLNLLENTGLEIKESILQISQCYPNVKRLEVSLALEEDVSYIMEQLPGLEILNGI